MTSRPSPLPPPPPSGPVAAGSCLTVHLALIFPASRPAPPVATPVPCRAMPCPGCSGLIRNLLGSPHASHSGVVAGTTGRPSPSPSASSPSAPTRRTARRPSWAATAISRPLGWRRGECSGQVRALQPARPGPDDVGHRRGTRPRPARRGPERIRSRPVTDRTAGTPAVRAAWRPAAGRRGPRRGAGNRRDHRAPRAGGHVPGRPA